MTNNFQEKTKSKLQNIYINLRKNNPNISQSACSFNREVVQEWVKSQNIGQQGKYEIYGWLKSCWF